MGFVQSDGVVVGTGSPFPPNRVAERPYGITSYGGYTLAYEVLYRRQPNVRTVVSFLGRNMAQLRRKLFERVDDTNRAYRRDHPLDRLMRRPNPRTSRYAFNRALVEDLGVFDNALALKVRSGERVALLRIPPQHVEPIGANWLFPEAFRLLNLPGRPEIPADQMVHLHGYNPSEPRWGLSPIETLRQILAEDTAASEYRQQIWETGARHRGIIERPADAPSWKDTARDRFRQDFTAAFAGNGPEAGGTPILEDGMTWRDVSFNAQELEYLGARKLTRAEVAAAYHVDPSLVGALETGNIAAADAAHTRLYQDTFGPLCNFIDEELTLQLLPDFEPGEAAFDAFYLESDLDAKLAGDFATEAEATSRAVGAPWLLRNEARARRNLPPVDGGDELVTPLNVTTGGRASPADTAPGTPGLGQAARRRKAITAAGPGGSFPDELAAFVAPISVAVAIFAERQRGSVLSKLGAGDTVAVAMRRNDLGRFPRWDQELTDTFGGYALEVAPVAAAPIAERFDVTYDLDVATAWLVNNARIAAESYNDATYAALEEVYAARALEPETDLTFAAVFDAAAGPRADAAAADRVGQVANFARQDVAHQGGATTKTWITTSANARASHAAMSGETVNVDEAFSNGGLWPHDPNLPVGELAGCTCLVEFTEADPSPLEESLP